MCTNILHRWSQRQQGLHRQSTRRITHNCVTSKTTCSVLIRVRSSVCTIQPLQRIRTQDNSIWKDRCLLVVAKLDKSVEMAQITLHSQTFNLIWYSQWLLEQITMWDHLIELWTRTRVKTAWLQSGRNMEWTKACNSSSRKAQRTLRGV